MISAIKVLDAPNFVRIPACTTANGKIVAVKNSTVRQALAVEPLTGETAGNSNIALKETRAS